MAEEIFRLITDEKMQIGFGDIAILVRTNRQAKRIQQVLSAKNIPCVLYQTGNIFKTSEASEIQRVLAGIAKPSDHRCAKAALSTSLFGTNGFEFDFSEPTIAWENRIASLKRYHTVWKESGFISMLRRFMAEENVKERLMRTADGERRLTNLLHLSELLHQADIEKKTGVFGLIKWLSEKRNADAVEMEEHFLRLEKDAHAVNILTIHKSKGLEFSVVFCPFIWDESTAFEKEIEYHDPDNRFKLTLDLGSDNFEKNKKIAQRERLAENLRLLYVSLTRAKRRCYITWGRVNGAEASAPAYLFHYGGKNENDMISALKKDFHAKPDSILLADLEALRTSSKNTIALLALPANEHEIHIPNQDVEKQLSCRTFSKTITRSFKVSSYSSLISDTSIHGDFADRDLALVHTNDSTAFSTDRPMPLVEKDVSNLFEFPRGTQAGLFFHDVLEYVESESFTYPTQEDMVIDQLSIYGFDVSWKTAVLKMIDNVRSLQLLSDTGFTLSSVSAENRSIEMAFYYPTKKITNESLSEIFKYDINGLNGNNDSNAPIFSPFHGFMKGFIDLIIVHDQKYYIIDWKSNYLGPAIDNYRKTVLNSVMKKHHYTLQYIVYTLALHNYLRLRIPQYQYEKHFGGVFYLFIRGIDAIRGNEYGVVYDKPDYDLINTLDKKIIKNNI